MSRYLVPNGSRDTFDKKFQPSFLFEFFADPPFMFWPPSTLLLSNPTNQVLEVLQLKRAGDQFCPDNESWSPVNV